MEIILGYSIIRKNKDYCVNKIVRWIQEEESNRYLVCANPHSLEIAKKDTIFENALKNADMVIPDGIGIVIASKILGGYISERVTGGDIFTGVSKSLNIKNKYRYYFLGSTSENLNKIKRKMLYDFPNIYVAGTFSPPFKSAFSEKDNQLMIEKINRANPDVLWVGMTAPKQEKWIFKNKQKLNVKFIGAIGAVFDFYTGSVNRPHPWFQDHGLEWLPRLVRQPRHLWRRNLISGPAFILRIVMQRYLS